jgi:hypothetical protein
MVASPKSHSGGIGTSHPILTVGRAMHEKVLAVSTKPRSSGLITARLIGSQRSAYVQGGARCRQL